MFSLIINVKTSSGVLADTFLMDTDVIHFDFPPIGGNIDKSRAAINHSLTGRNRRVRGRLTIIDYRGCEGLDTDM